MTLHQRDEMAAHDSRLSRATLCHHPHIQNSKPLNTPTHRYSKGSHSTTLERKNNWTTKRIFC